MGGCYLVFNQSVGDILSLRIPIWNPSGNYRYVVKYIGVKERGPGKTHKFVSCQCIDDF